MKAATCLLAFLIARSTIAFAQEAAPPTTTPKTPVVKERQLNQRARLNQGVKSGELTRGEAARLRLEERQIQADKRKAKSDGVVTPGERQQLRKEQNKASRDIYRMKHNNRERVK